MCIRDRLQDMQEDSYKMLDPTQPPQPNCQDSTQKNKGQPYPHLKLSRDKPADITCPSCSQNITTKIDYRASNRCCSYCIFTTLIEIVCQNDSYDDDNQYDAYHFCPNCQVFLGSVKFCG
eukprot:TRINITY_DN4276_c0_g1_i16.p1 TRINITY_DN4276_c0_g1~~TRINITY_DN4276_c0_g1_i16.p1  ORF type:complete len:120 (-),score=3.50 TRINITY_DN4276_c0_g1_i16:131-490(-)